MASREDPPAWLRSFERGYGWLYPWLEDFVPVYERVDARQRAAMRAQLAAVEKELLIMQALRSPARCN